MKLSSSGDFSLGRFCYAVWRGLSNRRRREAFIERSVGAGCGGSKGYRGVVARATYPIPTTEILQTFLTVAAQRRTNLYNSYMALMPLR